MDVVPQPPIETPSESSKAPHYTSSPSADERVLQRADISREQRTGTFVRSDAAARLTVLLAGQKDDSCVRPAYGHGRASTICGSVFLAAQETVVSVDLKLEGLMEALSVSLGYQAVKLIDQSLSLYSKTSTSTPCPGAMHFTCRFPATFTGTAGKNNASQAFPLPPSCDIAFPDGGFLKCLYSLTVRAVHRSGPFAIQTKERSICIELDYRQRTRPSRPRIPDPSLRATIKMCPEEWLQLPLFVPAIGVFGLVEIIPFHVQLSGTLHALRDLLLLGSAGNANANDVVRQPIRMYLLRQGTTTVNTVLCEAMLRSLPPPHLYHSASEHSDALSWEGELHLQNVVVPSFDAGSVKVSYLIAVELTPPKNSTSTVKRARYGFPIKLTTDTWAGSAEGQE
ncbi:hypothetical protein C8F01DRAFT_1180976 [Mycena amicta]|nr:hypothetical protein C8F01DRAFT_1180976 [Mycena amicta]